MIKTTGNGHNPCAKGHNKKTLVVETLDDGSKLRHWICRDCLETGADPEK